MSIGAILAIIGSLLTIIIMWMQGSAQRTKRRVWAEFKLEENAYRRALAEGDPQLASQIAKKMQEMRDRYKFLGE